MLSFIYNPTFILSNISSNPLTVDSSLDTILNRPLNININGIYTSYYNIRTPCGDSLPNLHKSTFYFLYASTYFDANKALKIVSNVFWSVS